MTPPPNGERAIDPFEAFNLFTYDSVLILDVSTTPGPLLPGSTRCDERRPLLESAAAARSWILDDMPPDDAKVALLLCEDSDAPRAEIVSRWLIEEHCRRVVRVSRTTMTAGYPFLFVPSLHGLPPYPNEIVPGELYLGSAATANEAALDDLSISHIVSIVERNLLPIAGRTHKLCQIPDTDEAELLPVLKEALPFIASALQDGGRVLVHCERGASRSVSVVCAHLMLTDGVGLHDALAHVKAQRPCAQPNGGFLRQLQGRDVQELLRSFANEARTAQGKA
uniref:protein-tyrosine-phosphatase n=1 Tax=Prymnesium polylepis TaxID=72548 RepID=A0A7S4ML12_9EUKA